MLFTSTVRVWGSHSGAPQEKRTVEICNRMSASKTCVRYDWRSINSVWTYKPNISVISYEGYTIKKHSIEYLWCTNLLFFYMVTKLFSFSSDNYFILFTLLSIRWNKKLSIVEIFWIYYILYTIHIISINKLKLIKIFVIWIE